MIDIDAILLVGAAVLIAAIVAARVGSRVGLPSLLLFLGLGMVMGESGFGLQFEDADLAQALGFAALVIILAEGGLTTKWSDISSSLGLAGLLATVGVGVSIGLMALFGYFVLGLDFWLAVLLGAVTSPTDSAAVFSVLRNVPIPHRLRGALEAESGLNDAPTVLIVILASEAAIGHPPEGGLPGLLGLIVLELVGGLAVGVVLGWLGVQGMRRVALPSSGLYPLAALVWSVLAYGAAATLHLSGFAAVYAAALLLGNARLPHRIATRSFVEGTGWIAQIGLFVMLGLLASPGRIDLQRVLVALAAGLFLTLVARPLSVVASAVWFKVPIRKQVFLSWAGLRGAVPIVLATIPLAEGVGGAEFLFDVVLVFVIVFTVLQAPTLPFAPRDRRRGRAAGHHLRRPAAGPHPADVPAGRRRDRGAAPTGERRGLADHPRGPPLHARRVRADQGRRRAPGGHPRGVPGQDRGPVTRCRPQRSVGRLARPPRPRMTGDERT
jgi:cell volume regulation protein A